MTRIEKVNLQNNHVKRRKNMPIDPFTFSDCTAHKFFSAKLRVSLQDFFNLFFSTNHISRDIYSNAWIMPQSLSSSGKCYLVKLFPIYICKWYSLVEKINYCSRCNHEWSSQEQWCNWMLDHSKTWKSICTR